MLKLQDSYTISMLSQKKYITLSVPPLEKGTVLPKLYLKNTKGQVGSSYFMSCFPIIGKYKNYLDKIDDQHGWDNAKKLSNPFEMIYQTHFLSVARVNPISRSYFKLTELIQDFDLVSSTQEKITYAAFAEGPGGFVEAFIDHRKKMFLGKKDNVVCMTLKSKSDEVPNWNKAKELFYRHNIEVTYGADGTGDIYQSRNIKCFRSILDGNKADLVTADGGFDYSTDFNGQEHVSARLIFAEMIGAFHVNRIGGHFVVKIFDIYTPVTLKLLYLASLFYEEIHLVKPLTSRPANSEKYLVCKRFRGISKENLDQLVFVLYHWNRIQQVRRSTVVDILHLEVPVDFTKAIHNYNLFFTRIQIRNILKTITLMFCDIEEEDLMEIRKQQYVYALDWCLKYRVKYHKFQNKLFLGHF